VQRFLSVAAKHLLSGWSSCTCQTSDDPPNNALHPTAARDIWAVRSLTVAPLMHRQQNRE